MLTNTQVQYWSYVEDKRHNIVSEKQEGRKINESIRHNMATEGENVRHNMATEGESKRHNLATEGLSRRDLKERKRHNLATEMQEGQRISISSAQTAETVRHNRAQEGISGYEAQTHRIEAGTHAAKAQADIAKSKADIARTNAEIKKIIAETSKTRYDALVSNARYLQGMYDLQTSDIRLLATLGDPGKLEAYLRYNQDEFKEIQDAGLKAFRTNSVDPLRTLKTTVISKAGQKMVDNLMMELNKLQKRRSHSGGGRSVE